MSEHPVAARQDCPSVKVQVWLDFGLLSPHCTMGRPRNALARIDSLIGMLCKRRLVNEAVAA
jgi:hypothetical protein